VTWPPLQFSTSETPEAPDTRLARRLSTSIPQLALLGTTTLPNPAHRGTMRVPIERTGIIATSSLVEEDVEEEQPITRLGELQVDGGQLT
jgi:hypothetical protein